MYRYHTTYIACHLRCLSEHGVKDKTMTGQLIEMVPHCISCWCPSNDRARSSLRSGRVSSFVREKEEKILLHIGPRTRRSKDREQVQKYRKKILLTRLDYSSVVHSFDKRWKRSHLKVVRDLFVQRINIIAIFFFYSFYTPLLF